MKPPVEKQRCNSDAADYTVDGMQQSRQANAPDCGSHSARWHVIQTHAREEQRAARELENQGFETHLPLEAIYSTRRVWESDPAGKRKLAWAEFRQLRAYFPGYMFVRFDPRRDRWRPILSTRGVRRLFTTGAETPIAISDRLIEELIDLRNGGDSIDRRATQATRVPLLPVGAHATVLSGPFQSFTGTVEWSDDRRVRLLLAVFGRQVRADFGKGHFSEAV